MAIGENPVLMISGQSPKGKNASTNNGRSVLAFLVLAKVRKLKVM